MKSNLNFLGYLKLVLFFIFWPIAVFIILFGIFLIYIRYSQEPEKPVSIEDIAYLCSKLEIEKESICNSNENIYPEDFSDIMKEIFQEGSHSYKEIQSLFSKYQTSLDTDTTDSASKLFISYYDINRDGFFDFAIYFEGTPENSLSDGIVFAVDLEY